MDYTKQHCGLRLTLYEQEPRHRIYSCRSVLCGRCRAGVRQPGNLRRTRSRRRQLYFGGAVLNIDSIHLWH